jgi:hypothetical protein
MEFNLGVKHQIMQRRNDKANTNLLRQYVSSEVSQGKLESSVSTIYEDLDCDERVRADWHGVRCLGSHRRQTGSSGQVEFRSSLGVEIGG